MTPQVPSPISRNSHQASVIDVPDEEEPVAQMSTRNIIVPLAGLHSTAQTTASVLRHRHSSPLIASTRVGIEGVSASAHTPTRTSTTAHNLRTVFTNSSNNTFTNPIITTSARDSNSYEINGPVTFNVHDPDFSSRVMLRNHPTELRGFDSTPPVSFSDPQGSVSLRPWIDADALDRGGRPEAPTTRANSRFSKFVSWGVSRIQDTNDLIGPSNSFFFCD
ncbi:hypothetical protein K435DRAFT_963755 [Dendrothele bispora CBS 962.96]|uniref:Uncharacterized protein n=1 Tax=Dendrothele bispora (strain CBS 962.96) TaxID=1314807 RepID=A0A4S8MEG3_DENBC|nr:hypothetical protein K435DRAFT_963755 [Dendrothele bispora CBS 962.96]